MDAVLDRWVQLETYVRRELEVLQPAAELVPDQAPGGDEPRQRLLLLLRVAEHADANARRPEVRRHANRRDAHKPDPRVLEVAPNDGHDLLTYLLPDLIGAVAGHDATSAVSFVSLTRFLPFRADMSPWCRRPGTPRILRPRFHTPAPRASRERLP